MRLIILGPQGSGKGTQAQIIVKEQGIPQISTGDIFRENLKNETELGKLAQSYMNKGQLVPDEVVIKIVEERLLKDDVKNGFILDGFPRTLEQANALDKIMDIHKVIEVAISDQEAVNRISGRQTCSKCGAVYHVKFNPSKEEGVCDKDGAKLIQRDDDKPDAIKKRLETYHKQTEPLKGFYKEKGILIEINGKQPIDKVASDIKEALSK